MQFKNLRSLAPAAIFILVGAYTLHATDSRSAEARAAIAAKPEVSTPPAKATVAVPLGQLGKNVKPTHYQLELTLIPEKSDFGGKVDIDVAIGKPTDRIFLHGQGLKVDKVTLQQDALALDASYTQVHDSGGVRVDLPKAVSGNARLSFHYTARYSQSLDAI